MKLAGRYILFVSVLLAGGTVVFAQSDAKAVVAAAFRNLEVQKFWTGEQTGDGSLFGAKSKFTVEFVAPDRAHMVWTLDGEVLLEAISIGKDDYVKTDGRWEKSQKNKLDDMFDGISDFVSSNEEKYMINIAPAGTEKLDGVETSVYSFDYDVKGMMRAVNRRFSLPDGDVGSEKTISGRVWINPAGLPVRFENVTKTGGPNGRVEMLTKITTYRFERETMIEAPAVGPSPAVSRRKKRKR